MLFYIRYIGLKRPVFPLTVLTRNPEKSIGTPHQIEMEATGAE
jgi:hypothetical protein